MSQFDKQFLQQQIALGNITEVIQLLTTNAANIPSSALRQEVLHLSARWHDYERVSRMGTAPQTELDVKKRQIDHSLFSLLDKIEPDTFQNFEQKPKQQKWRNFFLIASGILAALAGIAEITGKNISNLFDKEQIVIPVDTPKVATISLDTIPTAPPNEEETERKQPNTPIPSEKAAQKPKENTELAEKPPKTKALKITCTTNKGNNNLRFQKGATVAFYYQVNQPCYVRIIGKLADGRIVLIYDDQRMEQADVNKQLMLAEFEVDDPLGEEQLYFFAQKKKFPTLTTAYSADEYDVITAGLPKALAKTRGFKVKNEYAEARLDVETYQ